MTRATLDVDDFVPIGKIKLVCPKCGTDSVTNDYVDLFEGEVIAQYCPEDKMFIHDIVGATASHLGETMIKTSKVASVQKALNRNLAALWELIK